MMNIPRNGEGCFITRNVKTRKLFFKKYVIKDSARLLERPRGIIYHAQQQSIISSSQARTASSTWLYIRLSGIENQLLLTTEVLGIVS